MDQLLNSDVNPRSISLIGTIMVAGTIAFSIAGLHATPSQNEALDTFLQKGVGNFRSMGSTKSRSVSESGTTYLMEDIKGTNRELGYLLLGEFESTLGIISAYPPKEMTANNIENSSNLPENPKYEISPNGGIINTSKHLMNSFTAGAAYDTSNYTKLEGPLSPSIKTPDGIEVMIMAMAEQLTQLTRELRELDKKYDGKIEGLNKDLDSKFVRLEAKIDTVFDKLSLIATNLSDKVSIINTDVAIIKSHIETQKTWKERLQMPLITGLIIASFIVIANHLPAIFNALVGSRP